ncbi:MAG: epoxyqueuosine reductase QueH [Blautia sp.]|nr:epoxyqueuosine reductase QueH [Bacillota bacterium]
MEQKRNYRKELEKIIEKHQKEDRIPTLFLHSCCAPCSSYVLEYLSPFFRITDFFYNPNISPESEYKKREEELERLIERMPFQNRPVFLSGAYCPEKFYEMAKGMESIPEGGERCFACYRLRLEETARMAAEGGYDYFATTLTISPLKNAAKLNEIGEELEQKYGVKHLPSDFKKKNGYKRSIELSAEYDLYRQDFCGCVFSKRERDIRKNSLHRD